MPRLALPFLAFFLAACSPCTPEPDGVRFESLALDLGGMRAGEARCVPLPWRRTGSGVLRVLALESDCGCAQPRGLSGRLAPGARGRVEVDVRAPTRPGPFTRTLTLYTAAPPPGDCVRVRLEGWVGAPAALRPARLDVGPVGPGAVLRREVQLDLARRLARLPLRVELEGLAGSARLGAALRHDGTSRLLALRLEAPQAPGALRGRVTVAGPAGPLARLAVAGRVEAPSGVRMPRSGHPGRDPPR